jgi:hypothetical protein
MACKLLHTESTSCPQKPVPEVHLYIYIEWDERRGVNIMQGLDESLPIIGVKFEYSWTAETAAARASRAERAAPIKMLDEALATSRPSTE